MTKTPESAFYRSEKVVLSAIAIVPKLRKQATSEVTMTTSFRMRAWW
jgi:hypothetical protein